MLAGNSFFLSIKLSEFTKLTRRIRFNFQLKQVLEHLLTHYQFRCPSSIDYFKIHFNFVETHPKINVMTTTNNYEDSHCRFTIVSRCDILSPLISDDTTNNKFIFSVPLLVHLPPYKTYLPSKEEQEIEQMILEKHRQMRYYYYYYCNFQSFIYIIHKYITYMYTSIYLSIFETKITNVKQNNITTPNNLTHF